MSKDEKMEIIYLLFTGKLYEDKNPQRFQLLKFKYLACKGMVLKYKESSN